MDMVTQLLVAVSKAPQPNDSTIVIGGSEASQLATDISSLPDWYMACIESIQVRTHRLHLFYVTFKLMYRSDRVQIRSLRVWR